MEQTAARKREHSRYLLVFFMLALAASGLSAIPLQWEVGLLNQWFGAGSFYAASLAFAGGLDQPCQ